MTLPMFLIGLVQGWVILGALVAVVFVLFGMNAIDEDARGAVTFRPLIIPGIVLIWPLVLWRWWILTKGTDNWHLRHTPPRQIHGPVWVVMAIVLLLTITIAFALRQTWPAEVPSIQIAPATEASQ